MNRSEAIKQRVSIADVIEHLGIKTRGKLMRCPTPEHEDKNPSTFFDDSTGRWTCQSCGARGSVIDLWMHQTGEDFKQTLDSLQSVFLGGEFLDLSEQTERGASLTNSVLIPRKKARNTEKATALYEALYSFCLSQSQKYPSNQNRLSHGAYMKSRGLLNSTLKRFRVFVLSNYKATFEHLLESFGSSGLSNADLLSNSGNFRPYRHRLFIPYLVGGSIVGGHVRAINPKPDEPKYLAFGRTDEFLFNADYLLGLNRGDTVHVFEGAFDCMSAIQSGLHAVAFGTITILRDDWITSLMLIVVYVLFYPFYCKKIYSISSPY